MSKRTLSQLNLETKMSVSDAATTAVSPELFIRVTSSSQMSYGSLTVQDTKLLQYIAQL